MYRLVRVNVGLALVSGWLQHRKSTHKQTQIRFVTSYVVLLQKTSLVSGNSGDLDLLGNADKDKHTQIS